MTATQAGSILVTGAAGGLGTALVSRITTTELSAYYGIYTARDPSHTPSLDGILTRAKASGHDFTVAALDLSTPAKVREFAADINARVASGKLPTIHALILNAGFQDASDVTLSADGVDMSFAVNHLGNWLLALLLLQSMDKEKGRIVVVSSWSHEYVPYW
jgi:NAD(P)-dependent dehydrogenase (short-subunit alcohol dehydrogenase family)